MLTIHNLSKKFAGNDFYNEISRYLYAYIHERKNDRLFSERRCQRLTHWPNDIASIF